MKNIIENYGPGMCKPWFINRRKAAIRSMRANGDGSVDVEVYHLPFTVVGDDVKTYKWHLPDCEVRIYAEPGFAK